MIEGFKDMQITIKADVSLVNKLQRLAGAQNSA